jgi:3-oxoacyl-[acyl-carrier protein] reductase
MGRLESLVAVVTGAGSGIGAASALAFAREGAAVLVADLNGDSAERTAADIRASGGAAEESAIDVTDNEHVERMLQAAVDRFGKLDILFNNAGTAVVHAVRGVDRCVVLTGSSTSTMRGVLLAAAPPSRT